MKALLRCVILSIILSEILDNAISVTIPQNFYGSSEVYSGYLGNRGEIVDAFTLDKDHVLLSGDINSIENLLASTQKTGKISSGKWNRYNFLFVAKTKNLISAV